MVGFFSAVIAIVFFYLTFLVGRSRKLTKTKESETERESNIIILWMDGRWLTEQKQSST